MTIPKTCTFLIRIGLLFVVMLLLGCASRPGTQSPTSEFDMAKLYLYWPSSDVEEANHYIAAVNGKVVARLKAGSYYVLDQPTGTVVISSKAGSAFVPWGRGSVVGALEGFVETDQFIVEKGSTYYIHFPGGKLNTETSEDLEDLSGLDLLPPLK